MSEGRGGVGLGIIILCAVIVLVVGGYFLSGGDVPIAGNGEGAEAVGGSIESAPPTGTENTTVPTTN